ncbi:hypothetical protein [Nonomuraea sp. 10N515B]|uniref:hypothetical protein n=1 Tax=Nonomuraea sp. 10N515B TaxID=3457422 RepID=UPI003FCDABD4
MDRPSGDLIGLQDGYAEKIPVITAILMASVIGIQISQGSSQRAATCSHHHSALKGKSRAASANVFRQAAS